MNDESTCEECSEDYGPCEDHCEVYAQREGGNTRTADELLCVFIWDAEAIVNEHGNDDGSMGNLMAQFRDLYDTFEWSRGDGGWIDGDHRDIEVDALVGMVDEAESILGEYGFGVWREDGYVIVKATGGPFYTPPMEPTMTHYPSGVSYCDECRVRFILMDDDTHTWEECQEYQKARQVNR